MRHRFPVPIRHTHTRRILYLFVYLTASQQVSSYILLQGSCNFHSGLHMCPDGGSCVGSGQPPHHLSPSVAR
uniref:Putative secreted protein n=1 Tax=Anopheles darlingi TaxID=43151 RepID=A0A2M4DBF4_ANODA